MRTLCIFLFLLVGGLVACDDKGGDSDVNASTDTVITPDTPLSTDSDVTTGCPEEGSDAPCSYSGTCSYGTECCCGQCYDSLICSCENGQSVCYYNDACLAVSCGDTLDGGGGSDDVADPAPDVPVTDTPQTDDGGGPLNDADAGSGQCPAEDAIDFGASCDFSETCSYGTECCCGECYDSLVCECLAGETVCYYTDACLVPACPDAGGADGGTVDASTGDAGPDAGPLAPGQCETEADCDKTTGALCWKPDEQLPCGVCFSPPDTCTDDAACKQVDATTICKAATCACNAEKTCQPGCLGQDSNCAQGQTCADDGNCVATPCTNAGDCPTNFQCASTGTCERTSCSDSASCSGFCVKGLCYDDPGYCSPVPG